MRLLLLLVAGASLGAQEAPPSGSARGGAATDEWAAPLNRRVVLHLRDVSLREAIDRLAVVSRVRFSYSAELLPLDRAVRRMFDSVAVGDVLVSLLDGVAVVPVVAGPDQVVLAPARAPPAERAAPVLPPPRPMSLDRVVVTGSANGSSQRPLTVALDVVNGHRLSDEGVGDLSRALDGTVPGVWAWEQSPTSLLARYGSIRGASSFGANYPKIYVDGIEVANPLLITQIDPEGIERVEVIRGPQGAALYGADAISGVVNIVTRHEGVEAGAPHVRALSTGGVSESGFSPQAVFAQNHTLALATGSSMRSAQLDLGLSTLGAYYPGASSQQFHATGGMRLIGARTIVTGTARFLAERVGASVNPLLADSERAPPPGSGATSDLNGASVPQSLTQYTIGGSARFIASDRWTHTIVAGVDGYRLEHVSNEFTPFPSSTDSALRAARGSADRTTLRVSSVAHLGDAERTSTTLTFAAEHSALREVTAGVQPMAESREGQSSGGVSGVPAAPSSTVWLSDAGVITQADVAIRNSLFFTGGVRLERSDGYLGAARYSTLPMVGAAWVREFGDVTLKFRGAFGKGIRAPRTAARETVLGDMRSQASAADLAPEEQSGVEGGFDLLVGHALTLQVTRFDQLASGLIQQVVVASPAGTTTGGYADRLALQYQNVGAITNRGWELQATARQGGFSLSSALSSVESRVQRLALGYTGDLREGDRILDVPARTASLTAGWADSRWAGSVGLTRAFDWVDYDRAALARAYVEFDRRSVPLYGADLRGYWRQYDGITHLRASLTHAFNRGLYLVITGENLLNQQRGEPDNVTILPGRTVTTGLRASFF
ncbi:MAG: TonB-dependent receptor plug domain-containing protein [Gemmatimonadales bacterium]